MLWACKLSKLKEVVAWVEREPEPKGEMIVGPSREVLMPPDKIDLPMQINSFHKSACYSSNPTGNPYC